MDIRHVEEVSKSLGDPTLALLRTLFEKSTGFPPGVRATAFRAEHPEWMDQLHNMSHSGFLLKPDYTKDAYRISAYVLPLIEHNHASEILNCMEMAYGHLRQYYREQLLRPISTEEILAAVPAERRLLKEALYYMRDVEGWWSGMHNDFPLEESTTVTVNEQVLKYESVGDLIARVYEWNFINPVQYPGGSTWVDEIQRSRPSTPSDDSESTSTDRLGFEDLLHPIIRDNALQLLLDGHYREAVLNSVVAVFDFIRYRTGIGDDGDALVGRVLSLKNPLLILSDLTSESGQNDQLGFMQILKGAYQGIRNPKAHSLAHDLTEHKAAQYLIFASLLARRIEEASSQKK